MNAQEIELVKYICKGVFYLLIALMIFGINITWKKDK